MAETPSPGSVATPSDYILLTVIMKHDQTKNLAELNEVLAEQAFWAKFPPEGVEVESWYVAMGLGYIVTLRVPPARLREVNRAIEQAARKASLPPTTRGTSHARFASRRRKDSHGQFWPILTSGRCGSPKLLRRQVGRPVSSRTV